MEKKEEKTKAKKYLNIALNVIMYVFFGICLIALVLSVTSKKDSDGAISIFGMQMRTVLTPSMEKCDQTDVSGYKIKDIPKDSMVFIQLVPEDEAKAAEWYAGLKDGDVLTFKYKYDKQEVITHRIVGDPIKKADGGYIIHLEGDNKNSDTNTLTQTIDTTSKDFDAQFNFVIGKVTGKSYLLGLLVTVIKKPIGIVLIVIVPSVIIMGMEIYKLIVLLTEKKRKEEKERQLKRDEEFELMKQQLAMLQAQQANSQKSDDAEQ